MNLILHYDEELDLEFEIPELDPTGCADLQSLFESNSAEVNEAILSALHTGVEMQLDWVPVFTIVGAIDVFNLPRSEFEPQIERLTKYYSDLEEFELCVTLQNLKKKL